jgi:hypothetical protein
MSHTLALPDIATLSPINIYNKLISNVVNGPFYAKDNNVLPYSDSPTNFTLSSPELLSSNTFNIILNDVVVPVLLPSGAKRTNITSATNPVIIGIDLPLGESKIAIVNTNTNSSITIYVITKNWATLLAGLAKPIQNIESNITELSLNRDINTVVDTTAADAIWGKRLRNNNALTHSTEAYRELLQTLRQAYRVYGGKMSGLMQVVGAFTHVNPLVVERKFGPTWFLGNQFINNSSLLNYTKSVSGFTLSNSVQGSIDVTNSNFGSMPATQYAISINGITGLATIKTSSDNGATLTLSGFVDPTNTSSQKVHFNASSMATVQPYMLSKASNGSNQFMFPSSGVLTIGLTGVCTTSTYGLNSVPGSSTICIQLSGAQAITDVVAAINNAISSTTYGVPTVASISGNRVKLTGALTVYDASIFGYTDAGATLFSPAGGGSYYPYSTSPVTIDKDIDLVLNVTNTALTYTGSFTLVSQSLPSNWYTDTSGATTTKELYGWFTNSVTTVSFDNTQPTIFTKLKSNTWNYAFYDLKLTVWISSHPDNGSTTESVDLIVSFDGATWLPTTGNTFNVSDTNEPVACSITVTIPQKANAANDIRFGIKPHIATAFKIKVHKTSALVDVHNGLVLGAGSVPRGEHRSKRGYEAFIWGPEMLSANQKKLLGVYDPITNIAQDPSTVSKRFQGHIDTVASASSYIDRFEVNKLDVSNAPKSKNVVGDFTTTDFANGILTNMQVVNRLPSSNPGINVYSSYLQPTMSSQVRDEVVVPVSNVITTANKFYVSSTTPLNVLEDGVPVPSDKFIISGTNTITFSGFTPDTTKAYTVSYTALIQYETGIKTSFDPTDYVCYADAFHIIENDFNTGMANVDQIINFNANNIAILPEISNQIVATSTLMMDDTFRITKILNNGWSYVNSSSIRISSAYFNSNNVYVFKYKSITQHPGRRANYILEFKTAVDSGALTSATWQQVNINTPVALNSVFKMRMTYTGLTAFDDVKLYSLLVKGLNIRELNNTTPIFNQTINVPA